MKVVNQDGEMMGEMPTEKARQIAAEAGLDLVEVAPDARPPVCRIMDYGKANFKRKKKRQGEGARARRSQLKQIRLRAKIDQHDIDFKVRQAEMFLRRKDRVKVNVMFRGRENAHRERGREILAEIMAILEEVSSVEQPPLMEGGRIMSMVLAPKA